jgi:hypothetical protein
LKWLRPVSDRPEGGVSHHERRIAGVEPRLLDMVEMSLVEPRPHDYQTENWLLDATRSWSLVGRAEWRHLEKLADDPGKLWLDGWSTPHGRNDRVPLDEARALSGSLALIHVDRLEIRVFAPGSSYGDPVKRVQAVFSHRGAEYALRVTDPWIEWRYLVHGSDRLHIDDCYLTVSLGEPYNDYCYKLVAAIFLPNVEA